MSLVKQLYRASILHFPVKTSDPDNDVEYFQDGALIVEGETISALGDYHTLHQKFPNCEIHNYTGQLIIPGLIDSHVHFPQTEMIAKYGDQLLAWLENYTFPIEGKFKDEEYCRIVAQHFIKQLINNGTTTAFAYATVHPQSVDALFACATQYNMSLITGKVCMDRHCPEYLQDTPESAQRDSQALIEKWHGHQRNLYALTPRFAPTSSHKQLALLGELAQDHPSVFLQTHLSENLGEIEWVRQLFPNVKSYLDVYDQFNMVHKRSLFGHCIHLSDDEWQRISDSGATSVFCPSSNLFLGSGLFSLESAYKHQVSIALASDVGAGTSFNMLKNYGEAYKIGQLQHHQFGVLMGLYSMTQGPASQYGLDQDIGNLNPTTYADFVVLNPHFDELSSLRCEPITDLASVKDNLFALSIIGDDRAVVATYIAGQRVK